MKPLLIDLGNTRLKWAYLEPPGVTSGRALQVGTCEHAGRPMEKVLRDHWDRLPRPSALHVANVAGADAGAGLAAWTRVAWQLEPHFVQSAAGFGDLRNGYRRPAELGVDRWLSVVAAWRKYRSACCVLDLGSAVTLDLVTAHGRHLGGYILPGRRAWPTLLAQHTAAGAPNQPLPEQSDLVPGRSTAEAVAQGATAAVLGLTRAAMERLQTEDAACPRPEAGPVRLLLSGGDAQALLELCGPRALHQPFLVLQGLAEVAG